MNGNVDRMQTNDAIDAANLRIWEAAHKDPERSLDEGRRLEKQSRDLGYIRGVAEALRTQGYAYVMFSDYEQAFAVTHKALEIVAS